MRELFRSLSLMESDLQQRHGMKFNEAMLLCCIGEGVLSASEISRQTGLTPSNTSKVLRQLESKGWLRRSIAGDDHRQVLFKLTADGLGKLSHLQTDEMEVPELLRPLL